MRPVADVALPWSLAMFTVHRVFAHDLLTRLRRTNHKTIITISAGNAEQYNPQMCWCFCGGCSHNAHHAFRVARATTICKQYLRFTECVVDRSWLNVQMQLDCHWCCGLSVVVWVSFTGITGTAITIAHHCGNNCRHQVCFNKFDLEPKCAPWNARNQRPAKPQNNKR